jgi:hypothetical protein
MHINSLDVKPTRRKLSKTLKNSKKKLRHLKELEARKKITTMFVIMPYVTEERPTRRQSSMTLQF